MMLSPEKLSALSTVGGHRTLAERALRNCARLREIVVLSQELVGPLFLVLY